MKKINFLICAFAALLFISCEKETTYTKGPLQTIPQEIALDFSYRYPDAIVTDAYQRNNYDYNEVTGIVFTDKEGLTNTAIYSNGEWALTEKKFDVNDFLSRLPRNVLRAYLRTGIEDEEFWGPNNHYVIELSRSGLDNKQYEFCCVAPYSDGKEFSEHLEFDIVIADDGTLLTCSHHPFNRSVWWYDMSSSIEIVRNKYKKAPILGAVNDFGHNELFIRDNGIIKTVILENTEYGFDWSKTTYPLDINTNLPAHVLAEKQAYEEKHPEDSFYALSYSDTKDGSFYGLTYGSELNNMTFFVRTE